MLEMWEAMPEFWHGVFASLVAAAIFSLLVYVLRNSSNQIRRNATEKKREREELLQQLARSEERADALIKISYNAGKNLAVGLILLALGSLLEPILWPFSIVLYMIAIGFFYYVLVWLFVIRRGLGY